MKPVKIEDWSELAITEQLLADYIQKKGGKSPFYSAAKQLLSRIRPALKEATINLKI